MTLKYENYVSENYVYFLKPDAEWTILDDGLNRTFYYKDNIYLLKNGNKKLALSIKTKLDKIRTNCHEIAINKKLLPTIKTVDYQRADYRRAIAIADFVEKLTIKLFHQKKYQTAVTEMPT